jgi:hypothetical protein
VTVRHEPLLADQAVHGLGNGWPLDTPLIGTCSSGSSWESSLYNFKLLLYSRILFLHSAFLRKEKGSGSVQQGLSEPDSMPGLGEAEEGKDSH